MSPLIRRAIQSDADAMTAVFLAAQRAAMPWLCGRYSDAETRWWVRTTLFSTTKLWVAEEAARIVGFAGLSDGELQPLYVHPVVWEKGIGSQLLETVRSEPLDELTLTVYQRNVRARRFYEARGFQLQTLGTGSGNDENEPDACYAWTRDAPLMAGC